MIQSEAATRIASFAIGSVRERKKEGILCSFVWVFAWFYISSIVSPARRDIFVTSQASDSYYLGPSSSSSVIIIVSIVVIIITGARRRQAMHHAGSAHDRVGLVDTAIC